MASSGLAVEDVDGIGSDDDSDANSDDEGGVSDITAALVRVYG